ncbi:MAG: hypothetical protein M1821_004252 [Bathelium mastoideum]|nr:MAG: hypothetical protein M1821_004252 [Bathelium mastoideum]
MAKGKNKKHPFKPNPTAGNRKYKQSVSNGSEHSHFSLRDEAANTGRHYDLSSSKEPLRYKRMNFVSAGSSIPTPPIEDDKDDKIAESAPEHNVLKSGENSPSQALAKMHLDSASKENANPDEAKGLSSVDDQTDVAKDTFQQPTPSQSTFVVDTLGTGRKPDTGFKNPQIRSPSPTPSDSSEEVIVFRGRDTTKLIEKSQSREVPSHRTADQPSGRRPGIIDDPKEPANTNKRTVAELTPFKPTWDDSPDNWAHRDEKAARIKQESGRDVNGRINASVESAFARSRRPRRRNQEALDDYAANILANGEHMIPGVRTAAYKETLEALAAFEEDDEEDSDEFWLNELDDDDLDSGSEDEGLARLRDEDDRIARRLERMTDEQMARILAKQEELGLGSDDIILFDGEDDEDDDDPNNDYSDSDVQLYSTQRNAKTAMKGRAIEEQPYRDFDIMDFDRPSLQATRRGFNPNGPSDGLDKEQFAAMLSTWEADRQKKRLRKREREELRAQGLLGKKHGKPDLSAKYSQGIGAQDIIDEIRGFLMSTHESQAFPPMDKTNRKMLHQIAGSFHLKSKSVGSGKGRFPVLYKTRRTVMFDDDDAFARAEARMTKRFLSNSERKGKKGGTPRRGKAAASYQDGDIVGLSAPEIGADNKGRGLLEKMGWSHGMALGSSDNKGILHPLEHVVRNSRMGLG